MILCFIDIKAVSVTNSFDYDDVDDDDDCDGGGGDADADDDGCGGVDELNYEWEKCHTSDNVNPPLTPSLLNT